MEFSYMHKDKVTTKITVDYVKKTVSIINYTDDLLDRAFGKNTSPTFKDFENLLESRCFPRTRQNLKWELERYGLDSYNPLEIVLKTKGQLEGDYYSLVQNS